MRLARRRVQLRQSRFSPSEGGRARSPLPRAAEQAAASRSPAGPLSPRRFESRGPGFEAPAPPSRRCPPDSKPSPGPGKRTDAEGAGRRRAVAHPRRTVTGGGNVAAASRQRLLSANPAEGPVESLPGRPPQYPALLSIEPEPLQPGSIPHYVPSHTAARAFDVAAGAPGPPSSRCPQPPDARLLPVRSPYRHWDRRFGGPGRLRGEIRGRAASASRSSAAASGSI